MIDITVVQNHAALENKIKNFENVDFLLKNIDGTDLIVLPELFATGWDCENYSRVAESVENSSILNFLSNLAKKHRSNVVGGSFVRKCSDGSLKNSCPFFDRNGNLIALYDKMHLYSYLGDTEGQNCSCGNSPVLVSSDIGKIGLSVCYDVRFPELFRNYTFAGADILVNVAAWSIRKKYQLQTLSAARAMENQIFFVEVSQTGKIKGDAVNMGHSAVIDPLGNIVASAGTEETAFHVKIDLNDSKNLRKTVKTLEDTHSQYIVTEV